jgi:hypothetical protein
MAEMRARASGLRFPEGPTAMPDGTRIPGAKLHFLNP